MSNETSTLEHHEPHLVVATNALMLGDISSLR